MLRAFGSVYDGPIVWAKRPYLVYIFRLETSTVNCPILLCVAIWGLRWSTRRDDDEEQVSDETLLDDSDEYEFHKENE